MAHMIETMAYANATPWHGLGTAVSADMTPEEMAIAAQLNWPVDKLPVFNFFNGEYLTVEDKFNLTRMTDGRVLDVVGPIYKPVQNMEAIEFFQQFVAAGDMKMETAGSLDNGRRIWALASIQDGFTLAGGDRVNGYVLLCSPHKQGEAFTVKFCQERVVCHNTITIALSEKTATFRMSHAKKFDNAMKQTAREALGLAKTQLQMAKEAAELLSATRVRTDARLIEYVAAVSGSKLLEDVLAETSATGTNVLDDIIAATERTATARAFTDTDLNKAGRIILESILTSPGSDLESARGTYWGALNGVTHAIDHVLGRDNDSRLTSAWFGQRATMKQQAVQMAVNFAKAA